MSRRIKLIKLVVLFFIVLPASAEIFQHANTVVPAVVVTAKKHLHLHRSFTSGPKTTITKQQIRLTGATTLAEVLQNLGGVQLQDITGSGTQVALSMRGFGANASSNTLLLINGIPLTNPDLAPPDLSAIPLHNIQSIDIIAGSESVLYGDQAVGGTINILTEEEGKEAIEFACSAGSYNQHNCYAAINHHLFNTDNYLTILNNHTDNYREHNNYNQNLLSGYVTYYYPLGHVHFTYQLANEETQYPGPLTATEVRQNRRQASDTTDFFKNWNGSFHYQQQHQLSANWRLETDLAHRMMQGHGVLFSPFTQIRTIDFIKPQLKGHWLNSDWTGGVDFQDDRYRLNSAFGLSEDLQKKYGLFGLVNVPLASRLSLSMGARGAEQNSQLPPIALHQINRATAITIGVTYQLNSDTQLYLRRAGSFRFPNADEEASAGPNALRTQQGAAYESGAEWQRDQYSGKLGVYQLNLTDEIAFDPTQTAQQPFGSNRNLDPTFRRGFTVSGKDAMTEKLTLDGQYNFVDAHFQNGPNVNHRIPLVSEHILHAGLDYQIAAYWHVYTEAIYTGNQYAANDDANVAGKMGGYTTYNFNISYQIKNIIASLRFNNIFNKYYYLYTVYQPSVQSEFFYPAPERNMVLSIQYVFA